MGKLKTLWNRLRRVFFVFVKSAGVLFFLAGWCRVQGQIVDVRKCDSSNRFPITQYMSLLRTTVPIGIDSVRHLDAQHRFVQAPNKPVLVFNYDPYYYWFRMVVENNTPQPKDLMLLMAPIGMRDGQLFQKHMGQWQAIGKSGLIYRFAQRPYASTHNVFPFSVPARTRDTLYLSADASGVYKSFGFALIKPKDLKIFENKMYFIFGIIVGLLILFFLLNIALFFLLRIQVHLWYALYIGFLFLIVMKNDHLDQQFFHWDTEVLYHLTPYMAIGAVALAILMHVVMQFLYEKLKPNRFLYSFSQAVKINALLSGLAHFLFFHFRSNYLPLLLAFTWAKYSTLLASIVIIIDCIYSITKGFKSAYFIVAGLSVFLIGATQRLFFPSTLSFLFPPTTFHIGIILEASVISLALVYQYYWIEKQERRKQREAFRQREKALLQERHNAELEIKEQTMKNISEEIHDNIGQILSLVRININRIKGADLQKVQEHANNSSELVGKAIQDLRNLTRTLNTDYIVRADLVSLIAMELERVKRTGRYETRLEQQGDPYKLPHHLVLFRIFQESVNNVLKHADATKLSVAVCFLPQQFELHICDNGKGFDPVLVMQEPQSGLGIQSIKNRAHLIGATCRIESGPDGTAVRVVLPVSL